MCLGSNDDILWDLARKKDPTQTKKLISSLFLYKFLEFALEILDSVESKAFLSGIFHFQMIFRYGEDNLQSTNNHDDTQDP